MLDPVVGQQARRVVYRLSVVANDLQFLDELNLNDPAREELLDMLFGRFSKTPTDELIDGPFRQRAKLRNRTRFSDGSFPVFYSALSPETAEAEVAHWFQKDYMGEPKSNRTAYYQSFHCRFEGMEKDLRTKATEWPDLVHDSDYSFCNQLGAEARHQGLDALVVPSARHQGANVPVFARRAKREPELDHVVAITFSPHLNNTTVNRLQE